MYDNFLRNITFEVIKLSLEIKIIEKLNFSFEFRYLKADTFTVLENMIFVISTSKTVSVQIFKAKYDVTYLDKNLLKNNYYIINYYYL